MEKFYLKPAPPKAEPTPSLEEAVYRAMKRLRDERPVSDLEKAKAALREATLPESADPESAWQHSTGGRSRATLDELSDTVATLSEAAIGDQWHDTNPHRIGRSRRR